MSGKAKNSGRTLIKRAKSPESVGVSSRRLADFFDDLKASDIEMHSLMVMRHGKVAFEYWRSPYTPDIPHTMYSVSKSFTSTAIGFAIDEGLLSLDTRLVDVFPEHRPQKTDENLEKLTVYHLLTMTAGKDISLIVDKSKNRWTEDFFEAKWAFAPGEQWRYISENMYILCAMIHRVAGMSVIEYLTPRLFEPLGYDRIPFWEHDGNGIEAGGWGLFLTTEEFAKFILCYQQGGVFDGRQVIPADWVREATRKQVNNFQYEEPDNITGYGYCFWRNSLHDSYRADGMFSQFGIVFEDYDAALVITDSEIVEQKTRDCIWRHFPKVFIEDGSESAADGETRARLCLEPLSDLPERPRNPKLEGLLNLRMIKIKNHPKILEAAGFPVSVMPLAVLYMSADKGGGIDNIKLRFRENICSMTWHEGRQKNTVECGMDGEARYSRVHIGGIDFRMRCSAAWEDERTLDIWLRPMESICQRRLRFVFDGDRVSLKPSSSPGIDTIGDYLATCVRDFIETRMLVKIGEAAVAKACSLAEPVHKGILV